MARKVSDEFTVPLCRGHHREVHRCGDEATWWKSAGIDPTIAARSLWLKSHPLPMEELKSHVSTSQLVSSQTNGSYRMFRIALRDCVLRLRRYQLWAPFLLSCIVAILPPIEDIFWVIVVGAIAHMRLTAGFFKESSR